MTEGLFSEKTKLRAEMRRRLKDHGPISRDQNSLRIEEHVLNFSAWREAQTLCLYASLPSEPHTRRLMSHAWSVGKRVALPRVQHPDEEMSLHWVHSRGDLKQGPQGFEEPRADSETAHLSDLQLMVIPGIAFDRQGGRLGRGGGHYDRLLDRADRRAVVLGLFYSVQEVPRVPHDPWDQALHWVATEEGCFRVTSEERLKQIP